LRSDRAKRDGPMRAPHEAGTPLFYLKAMSATKTNRPSKEAARKERMAATPNGLCMAKSVIKPIVEPPLGFPLRLADIDAMVKSPPIHRWRIAHPGAALATIGYVEAPDEQTAIVKAIIKFNIGPGLAGNLIAEKTKTQTHPNRRRRGRHRG